VRNLTSTVPNGVSLFLLHLGLISCLAVSPPPPQHVSENSGLNTDITGYRRVTGPMNLVFPVDHGPHSEYMTEWWYVTGNLDSDSGRHFGYQLTFFRRALTPPTDTQSRESNWATNQVYMAHFALTDISGNSYTATEKFERGAAGLAGAEAEPVAVWLDNWKIAANSDNQFILTASQGNQTLSLKMISVKVPTLHGVQGYSQKGPDLGSASTYYSLSRLLSTGTVTIDGTEYPVSGSSWMDHEFSTSALSADQVGWDWFSIQLDDGTDVMLFHLRRVDGSIDPFSSGTIIDAAGESTRLSTDDFSIAVLSTWISPHSDATYPASWAVTIPSGDLALKITPYIADQELDLSFTYWEGAVHITGTHNGQAVTGVGYAELTGYAERFSGDF
jgi:predicted secreted hydrolase